MAQCPSRLLPYHQAVVCGPCSGRVCRRTLGMSVLSHHRGVDPLKRLKHGRSCRPRWGPTRIVLPVRCRTTPYHGHCDSSEPARASVSSSFLRGGSGHAACLQASQSSLSMPPLQEVATPSQSPSFSTLTVVTRFTKSTMYRGSPTSDPQSFGSLTIPLALSVVTRLAVQQPFQR